MREYKFRGINLCGNWVYGDLTHERMRMPDGKLQEYISVCGEPVFPKSVGQYTGHSDVMGTDMYEDDIVTGYFDEDEWPAVVEWDEVSARFVLNGQNSTIPFDDMGGLEVRIIGNIHDNPDLLMEAEYGR